MTVKGQLMLLGAPSSAGLNLRDKWGFQLSSDNWDFLMESSQSGGRTQARRKLKPSGEVHVQLQMLLNLCGVRK
jgi:hypothetical protein